MKGLFVAGRGGGGGGGGGERVSPEGMRGQALNFH